MPTTAAAPLLEPAFPTAAAPPPAAAPLSGRELYRRAVHAYLAGLDAQSRANEPLARRRPAQWDRAIDVRWDCLPSIVRRRWDAESHRLWPRNGDNPAVPLTELDLFCSPDEIYYVRRRRRKNKRKRQQPQWHMTEAHVRSRYLPVYNVLPPAVALPVVLPGAGNGFLYGHAGWADATNVINYARGLPPNTARLRAIPASQGFPDNGRRSLEPSFMTRFNDIGGLRQYQQNVQTHVWRWHKALGQGGFGIAMLYRYTDLLTHVTHFRVVVKRDRYHGAGDMERSVYASLQASVNAGIPYPMHIIGYQGSYTPALDTTIGSTLMPGLGRTYLDYAPFGCLHDLFDYYNLQGIIFPEPFLWHLLYCLTKAAEALEQPVPGHKAQMFNYDLKPENVLLDYPDLAAPWWSQRYPLLRTVDLGGVGVYPNAGQAENPQIRGLGTYGFRPWVSARPGRLAPSFHPRPQAPPVFYNLKLCYRPGCARAGGTS
ncbi:hypothetical protein B0J12DRAFT_39030 [Macrophomina phaseolina]|uniref:Protein kinase domain-containing protein n=1 Tax=Macrophomina phaseolina TaxID=35725 RepID=A0ABQ8GW82_9PEZI|nr:hypothetical protein B0J12DRAFT_39030 [Macrophomina phaseolina]